MPTVADLGQKIKVKFPGSYDDIPDDQLGLRAQAKHPGSYDDFAPAPAAVPVPAGLQGPPPGVMSQALQNLPSSALGIVRGSMGPVSAAMDTAQFLRDPENNPSQVLQGAVRPYIHPIDSFAEDPLGTVAAWVPVAEGARRGGPVAIRGARGAASGATGSVRPIFNHLPLGIGKFIPDIYDAAGNVVRGAREAMNPPPVIPGLVDEPYQPPKLNLPFTRGSETPEIGVRGGGKRTGWKLPAEPNEPEIPEVSPLSPAARAKFKFTPGSETPELGVSGRTAPSGWTPPTEPLIPGLDLSGLPEPGAKFKPNAAIKRRMNFSPGSEIPEIGVSGANRILRRNTPPAASANPAVDITTGQELVPAPGSPIPPVTTPGGSPVPPNAMSFKHPADYTDLNRQYHATHPKGTSLKADAAAVYGLDGKTMPTYEQALAIHEWRLKNPGKTPGPGLK